jgi:hypothetical protein
MQPFEVIIFPNDRMEDVKDHLTIIQQDPVAFFFSFNPLGTDTGFFQRFQNTLRDASGMKMRPSFTNQKQIGQGRFSLQINTAYLECFGFLELFQDKV